ncbi:nitrous oxide reductase family maturation protein NosD [Magnetococcus sp. PR-3]|uniref:nitrous oxide reductase family maturation protein NosD n=1 Tax=Magnetococcus sp. PR-3 TaxID=3120355 RepID=UPI002FCE452F
MKRWTGLLGGLVVLVTAQISLAATLTVTPQSNLQAHIDHAQDGDELVLSPGDYHGSVIVDRSLRITGQPGARIIGDHKNSVIRVIAPGVTISGLLVSGSGEDLGAHNAGVLLDKKAHDAVVENNYFKDNLFGVFVQGAKRAFVLNNKIDGMQTRRLNERGNGIHLWNTTGTRIDGNKVRFGRDGIFITTSHGNALLNNHFTHVRFAIHYMYANKNKVMGNYSEGNHLGYALMFSKKLEVAHNRSVADRDHGLMLNFTHRSNIYENLVEQGNADKGPGKCLFLYNASKNEIRDNHLQGCDIGIHFTAGSQDNLIHGNAFVGNRKQVKYVGTRHLEWSVKGRGNYWSDHPAFDLNKDQRADAAYRPNDMMDVVMWRYPLARLLTTSPAVQTLRVAQRRFPALLPGGIVDSYPLMKPVAQTGREGG